MSFLGKLFGKAPAEGNADAPALDTAVSELVALYDDPEVKSERGLSLTGPRAGEARAVGKRLHKSGGKVSMVAGFDLSPAGAGTKVAWRGEAQVFVGYPRGIAVGRGYLGPRDVTRKGAAGQRDAPRARFSFPR